MTQQDKFTIPSSVQVLGLSHQLAYITPVMMMTFLWAPLGILQGIYAKYYGVALTTIATVLLISKLFDAVTDPLIGYWSDRHQEKAGNRKPFVLVGGLLFIISSYFLYVPVDPNSVNSLTSISTTYFVVWFLLFYLAWTLFEIPHLAWAAELAQDTKAKNKIYSLRSMAGTLGILWFYLVPFLPFFPNHEFTPQTMQWAAVIAGLLMLPALYFCITGTSSRSNRFASQVTVHHAKKQTLWALRKELLSNKPFLLFFVAFLLFTGGSGMWFTLVFILVDSYLKLGDQFASITIVALVVSTVTLSGWYWLANRLGKRLCMGLGAFFYAMAAIVTGTLDPDHTGFMGLSLAILLAYTGAVPLTALAPSLLADITDYSTWKFRSDNTATYFALYTLAAKTAVAIGGSFGLGLAGWYGFDPSVNQHNEDAIFGLQLAISWMPLSLMLVAIFVINQIPINAHQHRIVRRRLDANALRESTRDYPHLQGRVSLTTLKPVAR